MSYLKIFPYSENSKLLACNLKHPNPKSHEIPRKTNFTKGCIDKGQIYENGGERAQRSVTFHGACIGNMR